MDPHLHLTDPQLFFLWPGSLVDIIDDFGNQWTKASMSAIYFCYIVPTTEIQDLITLISSIVSKSDIIFSNVNEKHFSLR